MKASILLIAASAGAALAHPAALTECAELCSSRLYNIPNCCTSDILGFAALDCTTRKIGPHFFVTRQSRNFVSKMSILADLFQNSTWESNKRFRVQEHLQCQGQSR